jgi:hypothetical protein
MGTFDGITLAADQIRVSTITREIDRGYFNYFKQPVTVLEINGVSVPVKDIKRLIEYLERNLKCIEDA